jgi:hypothetical protein
MSFMKSHIIVLVKCRYAKCRGAPYSTCLLMQVHYDGAAHFELLIVIEGITEMVYKFYAPLNNIYRDNLLKVVIFFTKVKGFSNY